MTLDVTGERYGKLVALTRCSEMTDQGAVWVFACDCGRVSSARLKDVRYGNTLSCGCLKNPRAGHDSPFAHERPWRLRQVAVRYARACARYRIIIPGGI